MVEEFKYLGIMVNKRGMGIDRYVQAGNKAYFVYREMMKNKKIMYETKMRTYECVIRPVVTNGA